MKNIFRIRALTLAIVFMITANLSHAQGILYDNGAVNGNNTDWNLSTAQISDSFTLAADSTILSATIGIWNFPGESLSSLQWSITTLPFGGTTIASGTATTSNTFLFSNGEGRNISSASFVITPTALAAGTYWLQLENGVDYAGWDQNNGPSSAYVFNTSNPVGSESFQILGIATSAPEPTTLALAGFGCASLFALRRRKNFILLQD